MLHVKLYVLPDQIREEFLGFLDVSEGTSGELLSKNLLQFVHIIGLDSTNMRSQCYDGAGVYNYS